MNVDRGSQRPRYTDENDVDHEDSPPYLRDWVRRVYEAMDRELAALGALLGPRDNLVVFAEQGMQANYRGDHLAELAVDWVADAPIDSLQSESIRTLSIPVRELRSGNHRAEGFPLASGPAFVAGSARLSGDLLQIPATLLGAHAVPKPAQCERGPLPILAS